MAPTCYQRRATDHYLRLSAHQSQSSTTAHPSCQTRPPIVLGVSNVFRTVTVVNAPDASALDFGQSDVSVDHGVGKRRQGRSDRLDRCSDRGARLVSVGESPPTRGNKYWVRQIARGPKPFSLVEQIGDHARVGEDGVVASDSFGNGHVFACLRVPCVACWDMRGSSFESWQQFEMGVDHEEAIRAFGRPDSSG
ncbi:hypothetical protein MGG_09741 [Pyricularia oryzae 70-15]|uniref:Uncharacterized protein n=3 Tax=Pyricularia oryzae TaxID=318829 RepID=G4NA44_PYRO7|nr:uncharacterized protein MGG_09741 [Pyricularia oryzae 70-15]EHA51290.1 hypothetical protein MGG_09741 [Pyricularia oryzae 70-15]ELQ32829.1 hypothetical protein OOU_Y34scaffold01029g3 [Pyricularia oryzae Y34]